MMKINQLIFLKVKNKIEKMEKTKQIEVQGSVINLSLTKDSDYICITNIANAKNGSGRASDIIKNWIRTTTTLEFLGTWEQLYNPDFKVIEFDHFKMEAGLENDPFKKLGN